jgi:RNA polymerase sigma-70 factor (ECF subfamily)
MIRHQEDSAAIQRCLNNEPSAFRELIERYKNQIFTIILRIVQNPSDAEDIAQEAFIKAFENLSSYDPTYPFITWLFKIAHNTSIDFIRARKPEAVSINDDDNPIDLAEPGHPIGGAMESVLQQALLEKLLAAIPPLYREALVLRHKDGLDVNEIAEVLQIPEGTAKIRLFRAREMLRKKLAEAESTALKIA